MKTQQHVSRRVPVTPVQPSPEGEEQAPLAVDPEVLAHRERTKAAAHRLAQVPKFAPRFAPGRPNAVPAEADQELAEHGMVVLDGMLRCMRQDCQGGLHVPDGERGESLALLYRTMDASGWQRYLGKWFCSKTCVSVEASSPAATLESRPRAPAGPHDPRDVVLEHGVVICAQADCGAHVPAHGLAPERAIEVAKAGGFVQTVDGVFCSLEHARNASRGRTLPTS